MTDERLTQELRKLREEDEARLLALAKDTEERARAPVRAVTEAWAGDDPGLSENAMRLMDELGELPIVPLLEAPDTLPTDKRVWMMRTVVADEVALRQRVEEKLEGMMDDQSPVPIAVSPAREEERVPAPRRVCDEAYMQLRLLVKADKDIQTYYLNVDAFLDLPEPERDAEIEKARASRTWSQLLEG